MAYGIPWDEAAPSGATTPADTIDTELQNLKISIRERINDVICDWSDDSVQPKVLCGPTVSDVLKTAFTFVAHDIDTGTDVKISDTAAPVFLTVTGTTDSAGQFVIDFTKVNDGIYLLAEWSLMTEKFWGMEGGFQIGLYVDIYVENGEAMLFLMRKEGGDAIWNNEFITGYITIVKKNPAIVP